ncbi:hypothetical protein PsYK624_076000 [Phanerochaete sordida]|uniref:Uncharacterized protein n=1 Tax=Phanerochaete sordida TaxID=48140 RepID=A0A9P3LDN8_9APHY|nr:hypothetical protein PsYK624_076000 [Phanerochaete sordida]
MRAGACHLLRIFGLRHKAVLLRRRVVARTLETPYRGPPCSRQHTGPSRSSPYTYTCAVSCVYQLCAEQRHFSASVRIRTIVADADVTGTIRDHTVYESGSRTTASAQYAGHRAQASEIGDHIFCSAFTNRMAPATRNFGAIFFFEAHTMRASLRTHR